MSYAAAAAARDRTKSFLGYGPDLGGLSQTGMAANASNEINDTKYGAMMDYNEEVGQATVSGINKAGAAAVSAQGQVTTGNMMGTAAGLFGDISSFGQSKGWFG